MNSVVSAAELNQILSDTPFTRGYHLRVVSLDDGVCTLAVPYQDSFDRPDGIVNGPMYMLAADVAMWCAIMTRLGKGDGSPTVTVEMKTNFLNSVRREDFQCTAKVLKFGRRIIYGTAECVSQQGSLLTHHTLTYIRPDLMREA